MQFTPCTIPGAWLIAPSAHEDDRGRFFRAWCAREFADHGIDFVPVQANMGSSRSRGTVRGLHFQSAPALEAKLTRCTKGAVYLAIVDLRPGSETEGLWYGVELSARNGLMLYVPALCAHGYQTLSDEAEVLYMTSAFYSPANARGVRFDDPAIGIRWPAPVTVVSETDRRWPLLTDHVGTP